MKRKLICTCLVATMILSLTACGKDKVGTTTETEVEANTETDVSEEATPNSSTVSTETDSTEEITDTASESDTEQTEQTEVTKFFADGTEAKDFFVLDPQYDINSEKYDDIDGSYDLVHHILAKGEIADNNFATNEYDTSTNNKVLYKDIIKTVYGEEELTDESYASGVSFTIEYYNLSDDAKKVFLTDCYKILKAMLDEDLIEKVSIQDFVDYIERTTPSLTEDDITKIMLDADVKPTVSSFDDAKTKKALKTGIFTDGKNNIKYDLSNLTYTVNDEVYTYPELREYLINVVPDNYNQQGIIDFSMDLFLISNIVLGNAHYDDTVILPYCEDLIHNYIANDEIAEGVLNTIYNKGLDTRLKVFEQYIVTD